MKNQSPMPLTVELGKLRIEVRAPDFKLTSEQEHAIADWWRQQIDTEIARQLAHLETLA